MTTNRTFLRTYAFGWLVGLTLPLAALSLHAEEKPVAAADQASLAQKLQGVWVLVGKPGEVADPPAAGGRLKFCADGRWVVTQADPQTGRTIFHHGGTYTLTGNDYAETIQYANENTAELIKQTFKFTIKIEGDTLTQVGIGNPFTEVWKRAK